MPRKRLTKHEKEMRAVDRLIARINRRSADKEYLHEIEAMQAKRASQEKGRYGRGDSVFDDRVTHGIVEINRDYHGCADPLNADDDGDVDAWRLAD